MSKQIDIDSSKIIGYENLKNNKGYLIIPTQFSYEQAQIISKYAEKSARDVIYLVEEKDTFIKPLLNYLEQETVNAYMFNTDEDIKIISETIKKEIEKNKLIIAIPGNVTINKGELNHFKQNVLSFLLDLNLPTVPLVIDMISDTETIAERNFPTNDKNTYVFGEEIKVQNSDQRYQDFTKAILEINENIFSNKKVLNTNLNYLLLKSLKENGYDRSLINGSNGKEINFSQILSIALWFAEKLKKNKKIGKRVGILVPTTQSAIMINLAVIFAEKIPVNINFTASQDSLNSIYKQSEITHIITAKQVVKMLKSFSWPPYFNLILFDEEIAKIKNKLKIYLIGKFCSKNSLEKIAKKYNIEQFNLKDKELTLLFTSGSDSTPKGVPLTHKNILANVKQFSSRLKLEPNDKILASLPLFHSFGTTVTFFFPIIEGYNVVLYPKPVDSKYLSKLVFDHKIALVLSTPTFLRSFLQQKDTNIFKYTKLIISGAEKLPAELSEKFYQKFAIKIHEGYGFTEASPVISTNIVDPVEKKSSLGKVMTNEKLPIIPSYKLGSVGKALYGVNINVLNQETLENGSLFENGILAFKGANIFDGYLKNDTANQKAFKDGWYISGDLGRIDKDGFLYIDGRTSRFSKIAGEMVSHGFLEEKINLVLNIKPSELLIAVVGIKDPKKGEATAIIHSKKIKIDNSELRKKLIEQKVPALWIPKKTIKTNAIPILGSGKLDIGSCKAIAQKKITINL